MCGRMGLPYNVTGELCLLTIVVNVLFVECSVPTSVLILHLFHSLLPHLTQCKDTSQVSNEIHTLLILDIVKGRHNQATMCTASTSVEFVYVKINSEFVSWI